MMTLKIDMLDALGSILPSNPPVMSTAAPGAPDFAKMVAVAEQNVPSNPQCRDAHPEHLPLLLVDEFDVHSLGISDAPLISVMTTEVEDRQPDPGTPTSVTMQSDALMPQIFTAAPISPSIDQIGVKAELPNEEFVSLTTVWTRAPKASTPYDKPDLKFIEPVTMPVVASVALPVPEGRQLIPSQPEPLIMPHADDRTTATIPVPVIDRVLPTLVERMVAFTPTIIDAARDLAQIGDSRDVRFNVRPETLGPVAVTIERTDAGQSLRLGVESPAAVQAVRHAEPVFNDQRGGSPFINVTVDLTASDQRGRTPRTASILQRDHVANPDNQSTGPALTGRYA